MQFLNKILDEIQKLYSENLNQKIKCNVILPNVIACSKLKKQIKTNTKSLNFLTLDQFILKHSNLKLENQETLLNILYKNYCEILKYNVPFIKFHEFGIGLLNDFCDINSHLLNINRLFKILEYQKTLDISFDYLSQDQKLVLREFWKNFENLDKYKIKFLDLWQNLPKIYNQFQKQLFLSKIGYKGMIQKIFYKNLLLNKYNFKETHFIIAGFSTLTKVESKTLEWLYLNTKTKIIWDFDVQNIQHKQSKIYKILQNNSIVYKNYNQNIYTSFENKNTIDYNTLKSKSKTKNKINIYKSSSQFIVLQSVIKQLKTLNPKDLNKTLLINFDPECNFDIYITLKQNKILCNTNVNINFDNFPLFQFIRLILNFELKNIDIDEKKYILESIFNHPYFTILYDMFKNKFVFEVLYNTNESLDKKLYLILIYLKISIAQYHYDYIIEQEIEIFNKFFNYIINLNLKIFKIDNPKNHLQNLNPTINFILNFFKKQQVKLKSKKNGVNILNIIDTSCLEYKNIFFLNATDSLVSKDQNHNNSNIPYNIKKMFALPTFDIYNDYFYEYLIKRLISKSKKTQIYYIVGEDNKNELSRYFLNTSDVIEEISTNFILDNPTKLYAPKNQLTLDKLKIILLKKGISPTALNTYLDCKFKFYLKYILAISDKIIENESLLLGNLIHNILEKCYENQRYISKNYIDILKENLKDLIEEIQLPNQNSLIIKIIKNTAHDTIQKILSKDLQNVPFQILGVELGKNKDFFRTISLDNDFKIKITGIIDRLEEKNSSIKVVDYKTGRFTNTINEVDELFDSSKTNRNKIALQLLTYAWIAKKYYSTNKIVPYVLSLKNIFAKDDISMLYDKKNDSYISEINYLIDKFENNLKQILAEIIHPHNNFEQTKNENICKLCEYRQICNR